MEGGFVCLLFGGFALLAVAGIGVSMYVDRQRTKGLAAVAAEMGLPFYESGQTNLIGTLDRFQLFSRGRNKQIRNMIYGDAQDVDVAIFDYRFRTGSGKNSSTHSQTVAYVNSSQLDLPQFALRPEHFFDRIGAALGMQDINFESHPVFSGKYVLKGDSESRVREFFDSNVLEYFESRGDLCVEGGGPHLIEYRAGKRVKPAQVRALLGDGLEVYQQLKNRSPA